MTRAPAFQSTGTPGLRRVLRRELRRIGNRPLYPMLLFVLPLIAFALLWLIFSAGTVSELPIAVIDRDGSPLSRRLVRMLDASPTLEIIERVESGRAAEDLLLRGKVYAAMMIPDGMERDVLRGEPVVATLYRNSMFMLPSSAIRRDVLSVTGTLSAGIEIQQREARGQSPASAFAQFEPIDVQTHALFNPWLNYIYFLVSSLLPTLLQIFIVVATVHAVGVELKDGSGRDWLDHAGGSAIKAVVGKLLPHTAAYGLLAAFMLTLIIRFMGVPMNGDLFTLTVSTLLFVLACQSLGILIVAVFGNLRLATSAAAFIATPAFAFVGLTFPVDAMPPLATAWTMLLPLTHYLGVLVEQVMRGAPGSASLREMLILAGFVALAPPAVRFRLSLMLTNENYWGRR